MRFRRLPAGAGTAVELCVTDRHDGDFRIDAPADELAELRRSVFDGEWTWLRQVHGSDVALVDSHGEHAGTDGDAAVTGLLGAVLCVQTADCVPVVVVGEHAVGVIHAGWRGLVAGVIDHSVEALRTIGSSRLQAVIGPCIRPGHYEFGPTNSPRSRPPSAVPAAARRSPVPSPSTWLPRPRLRCTEQVSTSSTISVSTPLTSAFSPRVRSDVGRQVTAARLVTA